MLPFPKVVPFRPDHMNPYLLTQVWALLKGPLSARGRFHQGDLTRCLAA